MSPEIPVLPSNTSDPARCFSSFAVRDADFYRDYAWCLSIYPTMGDSLQRLREELTRCTVGAEAWRRRERLTNVYLHCCAIADTTDDYLIGGAYDLSNFARIPFSGLPIQGFNTVLDVSRRVRSKRIAPVHRWRRAWNTVVQEFLKTSLVPDALPSTDLIRRLKTLTQQRLPSDLLAEVAKAPAAFRSQDLSHYDVLALGKQFLASIDDPTRPILIIGLRTAGSYFAPLLAAYLQANGCSDVDALTLRPKKGIAAWEKAKMASYAAKRGRAVLIDEPINTGKTLLKTLDLLRKSALRTDFSIVVPVHVSRPDWNSGYEAQALSRLHVVGLEPERWHKCGVLTAESVADLMHEWLVGVEVNVTSDAISEGANRKLEALSEQKFHNRLKRVHRVDLRDVSGRTTTRYVLAKGVGWGWYGYHAVLASERLCGFVPPLIGFRDGVLFEEWVGEQQASVDLDRPQFLERAPEYVAERTRLLKLERDPVRALAADNRHKATDELSGALGNAYGSRPAAVLRRSLLRERLTSQPCPAPTLIDGKMRPQEWVNVGGRLVKTDFEQHGLGKTELNVIDPAYDLADAVLQWRLSAAEETQLIDRYVALSGDKGVAGRLHLNKMLAGLWNMMRAVDNLSDARLANVREQFNRSYIDAWTFLIVQTARYTGELCEPKLHPHWQTQLVVMDIDGVLDRQIFGFPSTTAAGIRAVSLLHAHDCAVAINTARSVAEVKEYIAAYRMVGGVAEYGAYAWDAVSGKERVLVSPESLRQLEILAGQLRQIPGVFLNDDYKYSIRAFTYQHGVPIALPTLIIQNLIASLRLDRLTFHQTFLDTAVVAKETDKGQGLLALLSLAGHSKDTAIAIGDSEPDLSMFRVVNRSYAPAHILCKRAARMLGCQLVPGNYQVGLLQAAHKIVHNDGHSCRKCKENEKLLADNKDLFVELLQVADSAKIPALLKAVLSSKALSSLRQ
jgi:hydroxymethylpyrimidine pyrophosphatase-like HAD family hydrolase